MSSTTTTTTMIWTAVNIIMMAMMMSSNRLMVEAVDLGPTLYTGYVKLSNEKMKLTLITDNWKFGIPIIVVGYP